MNFETITFAPFDIRLVDTNLMSASEIDWLNNYHTEVREKLSPHLTGEDLHWLQNATQAV